MLLRYANLVKYPRVFRALTGLTPPEFDELVSDLEPRWAEAEVARLSRPNRQRDIGAGHPFELEAREQMLLTVVWLRQYPTHVVLGFLFGVSEPTVSRPFSACCRCWQPVGAIRCRCLIRARSAGAHSTNSWRIHPN